MFPRSFIFFIFIIIMDLILKSLKDKKKIEEARQKRMQNLSKQPGVSQQTTAPSKERREEVTLRRQQINEEVREKRVQPKVAEEIDRKSTRAETSFSGLSQDNEIFEKVEEKNIKGQIRKSNEKLKRDILKGIIFSEILSEPKSLRNRQKSM